MPARRVFWHMSGIFRIYCGMDTILYIYRKRGLREPEIEPVGLKSYMLVRVGLDVGEDRWFGVEIGASPAESPPWQGESAKPAVDRTSQEVSPNDTEPGSASGWLARLLYCPLANFRRRRREAGEHKRMLALEERRRCLEEQERARQEAERQERIREVGRKVGKLAAEVLGLAEERRACFGVYEAGVRKFLTAGEGVSPESSAVLPSIWRRHFDMGEFSAYVHPFWVRELLPQATWFHYVILGTAPCVYSLVEEQAGRMKSLRWIVPERDCSLELQEFVEDFYTEYGLAISLQILPGLVELRRLRLTCSVPTNILDFTGEAYIGIVEVAAGSVWLDMLSVEEKRRRIAGRDRGIAYYSLKERWKTAQRRCRPPDVCGNRLEESEMG